MDDTRASILLAQAEGEPPLLPMLLQEGYRVEQTRDIRLLLSDHRRLTPTLILLDSALEDAFALCAWLREQDSAPIVMFTPDDEAAIEHAYRVGAADVLSKPIQPAILRRRLRDRIEMRAPETVWQQTFERNRAIQLIINPKTGRVADANAAACVFYGYPREAMRGKLVSDLEAPSVDSDASAFNFRHRSASGQVYDVKIFSSPLVIDGQSLLYLIVHDISRPKEAAARASDERLLAEALRNTAGALSSTLDQDEVLDRILEQVNLVVPSESANVMLIEAGVARVARSRGYENQTALLGIDELRLKVRDTPTLAWMVENNRALAIPDTAGYPGWVKLNATHGWLKSYVAAPIRIGNYVIGFLNIDSSEPGRFGPVDADHLQIFADQAAIAIRNARLFERVRRQAAEMERRVLQRTAELEFEQSQLRAIIDAMTEGVAYTEYVDGRVEMRYVNQALCQMTGYSVEEWSIRSVDLFRSRGMDDDQLARLLANIEEALRVHGYWRYETRIQRKDGTEFDAMTITTGIHGASTPVIGAVTVIRDISQEKALQAQKARFVAYASHELRTPITNLKTRLYLMRRQPERMDEHMRVLEQVAERMRRLVEDLLDVSRFERGVINLDFREVALQDLIRNLVQVQQPEAERKQLTLVDHLPDAPIHVHADTERLAQVITNLLTNAINYTPAGGRIDVRLTRVCDVTGELALVEVVDTGIGISDEHLPHIFQPFYRVVSQIEGTGLGLSITKEIVELHGGEIEVDSQLGLGSTFRFWLPVIDSRTE